METRQRNSSLCLKEYSLELQRSDCLSHIRWLPLALLWLMHKPVCTEPGGALPPQYGR